MLQRIHPQQPIRLSLVAQGVQAVDNYRFYGSHRQHKIIEGEAAPFDCHQSGSIAKLRECFKESGLASLEGIESSVGLSLYLRAKLLQLCDLLAQALFLSFVFIDLGCQ